MKLDSRSIILGTMIGLMLSSAGVLLWAQQQLNITGTIYVPDGGGFEIIEGLSKITPTTYKFEDVVLNEASCVVYVKVKNGSSHDMTVQWQRSTPAALTITLEYDRYSYEEAYTNLAPGSGSFILPRGQLVSLLFTFTDTGLTAGQYTFTMVLMAS